MITDPILLADALFGPDSRLAGALPGFEPRPAQLRMAQIVSAAILNQSVAMVEAGTGTGKTLAYLLPILATQTRAVISTATKNLQDQIMQQELPFLRRLSDRPFTAVALKGRNNYLCLYRSRNFRPLTLSSEENRWLPQVQEWSRTTRTGDKDELSDLPEQLPFWRELSASSDQCLGQTCPDQGDCFLLLARLKARAADLVVVNHHLFFADLAVKDGGFGEILPNYQAVVFDEAHQIPEVVTQFFGEELSNFQIAELARDAWREFEEIRADDPAFLEALERLRLSASTLRRAFPDADLREAMTPDDLQRPHGQALLHLEAILQEWLEHLAPHRVRSPGLAACGRRGELLLATSRTFRRLDQDLGRVHWFETRGRGITLKISPLEVGPTLKEVLQPRLKTAIYTSATLADGRGPNAFGYHLGQLGLDTTNLWTEQLPPAFDYARHAMLYIPTGSPHAPMPEPTHPGFTEAAVDQIKQLLHESRGRAFCLFTSYRMMDQVRHRLERQLPYPLLTQGDRPKRAIIQEFKSRPSILLATSSFWEGVDVPGEALSLVIIDRLPFAAPSDPLVAARCRHADQQGGNSFREIALPRAVLALKQGLGRLLRRTTDRGVMAVLDVRLVNRPYGRHFLAGLPPVPIVRRIEAVRDFFNPPGNDPPIPPPIIAGAWGGSSPPVG